MGHSVVAVDPVTAFCTAARDPDDRVTWVQDALPDLQRLSARKELFDYVNLSAVWHHLDPAERKRAIPVLRRLVGPAGLIVMALRHGTAVDGMPVYPIDVDDTSGAFQAAGFAEVYRRGAASVQDANNVAGVTWTWLALRITGGSDDQ